MSELDLLHRLGDEVVPPPLALLRETARRRDRRAAATAATVAATAAALVATGVVLLTPHGGSEPRPTQTPTQIAPTSRPLTYAEGSVIHYGDQTVTTDGRVVELDVTDDGVAYRTADGRIWFTDGSSVQQLGELGETGRPSSDLERWSQLSDKDWIVSGNLGANVAWFEFPRPDAPEVVVYDTSEGEVVVRTPVEVETGGWAQPHSVDDRSAYWYLDPDPFADDSLPQVRLDLATGEQATVSPGDYLADIAARPERTFVTSHAERGFEVYEITTAYEWNFSVQGPRIEPLGMQPLKVRDGLTGTRLVFDAPPEVKRGSWFTQWLDDDTIVLVSEVGQGIGLLECRFSTGSCEVALPGLSTSDVVPELGTWAPAP